MPVVHQWRCIEPVPIGNLIPNDVVRKTPTTAVVVLCAMIPFAQSKLSGTAHMHAQGFTVTVHLRGGDTDGAPARSLTKSWKHNMKVSFCGMQPPHESSGLCNVFA